MKDDNMPRLCRNYISAAICEAWLRAGNTNSDGPVCKRVIGASIVSMETSNYSRGMRIETLYRALEMACEDIDAKRGDWLIHENE